MHNQTTSRHIRSSNELFLMVPIKPGFVQTSEFVATYSSRISIVLNALFDIRQQKIERGFDELIGPIELLETIYRVQWTVLEPFDEAVKPDLPIESWRQIKSPQLILTSHFDSSWEDYFAKLVDIGGPLLDLVFSHCVGYEGNSCKDGYERFSDYIRSFQRPINFIYTASPDVSERDMRHLKTVLLASRANSSTTVSPDAQTRSDLEIGRLLIAGPRPHDDQSRGALKAIFALREIRDRLFSTQPELDLGTLNERTGRELFDDAVQSVLQTEPDAFRLGFAAAQELQALKKLVADGKLKAADVQAVENPDRPLPWVGSLVPVPAFVPAGQQRTALTQLFGGTPWLAPPPAPQLSPKQSDALRANMQWNICPNDIDTGRDWSAALLIRCATPTAYARLIAKLSSKVTLDVQATSDSNQSVFTNLALTFSGLARSGLDPSVLARFPREFQEGLEERAGLIGDIEDNHPSRWEYPELEGGGTDRVQLSTVDAIVLLKASTEKDRDDAVSQWRDRQDGIHLVHVTLTLTRRRDNGDGKPPKSIDPFGFVDPVSQPRPRQLLPPPPPKFPDRDLTALGEFVLGYENRYGRKAACADPSVNSQSYQLFLGSTFLVVRKTRMDKPAFDRYVQKVVDDVPQLTVEDAKLRVVGRRTDGSQALTSDDSNDFDYSGDPLVKDSDDSLGKKCPLHAHARRANPRLPADPRLPPGPRIVRRGSTYGTWTNDGPTGENGVFFVAYNASLAEQYEIIQRWLNGANITGQASLQNDLHVGTPKNAGAPRWAWRDQNSAFPMPDRTEPFATLRWGLYGFVPSKSALDWLAVQLQSSPAEPTKPDAQSVERGQVRLAELEALPMPIARLEWKRLLEEAPEAGSAQARQADDVWAAITVAGGAWRAFSEAVTDEQVSPALVVVTSEQAARTVLGDDGSSYSVKEYARRMQGTIGDHYLAHDVAAAKAVSAPTYQDLSGPPNDWFDQALSEPDATGVSKAFANAHTVATQVMAEPGIYNQEPLFAASGEIFARLAISVRDLAQLTVARLCKLWFGMPDTGQTTDADPLVASLERFLVTSRYTFQARPEPFLERDANARGTLIPPSFGPVGPSFGGELGAYLRSVNYDTRVSADAFRQAVMGAVVGFAPPAVGAILRILDQWIESQELWRVLAYAVDAKQSGLSDNDVRNWIRGKVAAALGKTPSPTLLYRIAVRDVDAALGSVRVAANDQVVVVLGSVYADAKRNKSTKPEAWLFGGQHGGAGGPSNTPPIPAHGCPARTSGVDVIAAIVFALSERKNIRRERRFLLSYDRT